MENAKWNELENLFLPQIRRKCAADYWPQA
jgi:hypothetical protein